MGIGIGQSVQVEAQGFDASSCHVLEGHTVTGELRYTGGGQPVANFSLATTERVKRNDNWEERTEWHRIVVWGKLDDLHAAVEAKAKKPWSDIQQNLSFYSTHLYAAACEVAPDVFPAHLDQ